MCYAVSNTKSQKEIEIKTKAKWESQQPYQPYFHLSAFSYPSLHVQTMEAPLFINSATWGLIPETALTNIGSFRKKYHTFNARAEDLFNSKIYSESLMVQRCLIWADGFFEPHHINKQSIPYYCYIPEKSDVKKRQLFAFAGLYAQMEHQQLSCTIITTQANEFFAEIHNLKKRMPLVLSEEYRANWLDNDLNDKHIKNILAEGFTLQQFDAHPVSNNIYQPHLNTNIPSILHVVDKGTLF